VLGTVLALSRAHIPDDRQVFAPGPDLEKLVQLTHYKEDRWVGAENTWAVHDEVAAMYEFKAKSLFRELITILIGPFVLFFSTGSLRSTTAIIQFFQQCTDNVEGVGYVCSFANLDTGLEKHGDPDWGAGRDSELGQEKGKEKDEEGISSYEENRDLDYKLHTAMRVSRNGKMEKSLINFHEQYPTWHPARPGQRLLENISHHLNTSRMDLAAEGSLSHERGMGFSWHSSMWSSDLAHLPWTSSLLYAQQNFHEQAIMKPLVSQRRRQEEEEEMLEMRALRGLGH